ncbi:MAG: hypothetical protein K0Q73_6665 [Paenibacillus sp.]|nr:hypothetical protein [Paenibacillus sp.]
MRGPINPSIVAIMSSDKRIDIFSHIWDNPTLLIIISQTPVIISTAPPILGRMASLFVTSKAKRNWSAVLADLRMTDTTKAGPITAIAANICKTRSHPKATDRSIRRQPRLVELFSSRLRRNHLAYVNHKNDCPSLDIQACHLRSRHRLLHLSLNDQIRSEVNP